MDGIRPTLSTAETSRDGTQVLLTFSEEIQTVRASAITVTVDGTAATLSTGAVTIIDAVLTIALQPADVVEAGETVTVALAADAVTDVAGNGNLARAATAVGNTVPAAPGAPRNLSTHTTSATTTPGSIRLSFGAAVGADRYEFRARPTGGSWGAWTPVTQEVTSGSERYNFAAGLTPGTTYTLEVQGVNSDGAAGPASNQATGTAAAAVEITGVELTSDPGPDQTYGIGEFVFATLTFSRPVTIPTDVTARPRLELDFNGTGKPAACPAVTQETEVTCDYLVAVGDTAPTGIAIRANALTPNGARFQLGSGLTANTTYVVPLAHRALAAQAGHKVDGVRPTLSTAETSPDGTQVLLTFSEEIHTVTASAITVTVGGTAATLITGNVSHTGAVLTITLQPANVVEADDVVMVALAADAVADVAGNRNLGQAATTVTNQVGAAWTFTLTDADGEAVTELSEGGASATATVTLPNSVRFDTEQTVQLRWGRQQLDGQFHKIAAASTAITIPANGSSGSLELSAPRLFSNRRPTYHPPFAFPLTATHGGTQIGSIDLMYVDAEPVPVLTMSAPATVTEGEAIAIEMSLNIPVEVAVSSTLTMTDADNALSDASPISIRFSANQLLLRRPLPTADNGVQHDGAREVTVTLALPPDALFPILGDPSTVTITVLDNDTPPLAPPTLTAEPAATEATLTWQAPPASTPDHRQPVSGYEYRQQEGTEAFGDWMPVPQSDADTTEFTVTGLTHGTAYTVEVAAVNVAGRGAAASVTTTTLVLPTIDRLEFTSDPGIDNTYAINGKVQVTVHFSSQVDITAAPQLELDFNGVPKTAGCITDEMATATTTCTYIVAEGDVASAGIAIQANKLTGGTITATGSPTVNADLTYAALAADANHKVDGIRPTLTSAETSSDGTQVLLTFSEPLAAVPGNSLGLDAWTVEVDGAAVTVTASGSGISGATVTLGLGTALTASTQMVTVSYAGPGGGFGGVEDAAGNSADSFTDQAVTNTVPAAPEVTIAAGDAVTEGAAAVFTLTRTGATTAALAVTVTVAEDGAMVAPADEGAQTVTFAIGDGTATLNVATVNDAVAEAASTVTAALGTGTGYRVGTPGSASLTVSDNDGTTAPEMTVLGNGVVITHGDRTPAAADHTQFGTVTTVTDATVDRVFTIRNDGDGDLELGADAVSLEGTRPTFAVTDQPAATVAPAGTTTFTIRFNPPSPMSSNMWVSIANNDADEAPYRFRIAGTGTAAQLGVEGNGVAITDGDPSAANGTDFGTVPVGGGQVDRVFTVRNLSRGLISEALVLGATAVTISGPGAAAFTIVSQPGTSVATEDSTTFTVRFAPATAGVHAATVALTNNDPNRGPEFRFAVQGERPIPEVTTEVTIAAGDDVTEGAAAVFTLTRTGATTAVLDVTVTVSETRDVVHDADEGTKTVRFGATRATTELAILTVNDALDELSSTVTVTVAAGTGYTAGTPSSATVAVSDDDAAPTLSVADASVVEGDAGTTVMMEFTATLSAPGGRYAEVKYYTADGTATAGADFTGIATGFRGGGGLVSFPAGVTEGTIRVTVRGDDLAEEDETFEILFNRPENVDIGSLDTQVRATGTIEDDDARGVTVTPEALVVTEGGTGTYTVGLTSAPTAAVTVTVTVPANTDVTVDTDTVTAGDQATLTFTAADWATPQTVTVSAAADVDAMADAAVTLTHAVTGGDYGENTVPAAAVVVTVVETGTPTLSLTDVTAAEDAGTLTFTVRLSSTSSETVTVDWATADGTATAGSDYTAGTGTLTFPANSVTPQTLMVAVTDDDVDEADETVTMTLSNAQHAALAGGGSTLAATGTITDDDARGVTVTPEALVVTEGGTGTYTVGLTSAPTAAVTVTPTVQGSADVTVAPAMLTFTADNWATAQPVTVTAAADADAVTDTATITHTVSGGDYGTVPAAAVAVTVQEVPVVTIAGVGSAGLFVLEGQNSVFRLTRTGATTDALDVTVTVSETGAVVAASAEGTRTVRIPAGRDFVQFNVPTDDDAVAAGNSRVTATIVADTSAPPTYRVGTPASVTNTTWDDESLPVLTIADASIAEGDPGEETTLTFTVTLSSTSTELVIVHLGVDDVGSATADRDFVAVLRRPVHIVAGTTTTNVSVSIIGDDLAEEDETFEVRLNRPNFARFMGAGTAVGTILDDDAAPVVGTTAFTAEENSTDVFATLTATDADTTSLLLGWSIVGGADQEHFTLGATGGLSFTTAQDFENPGDAGGDGTYNVTVAVTDGTNPVTADLTVTLRDMVNEDSVVIVRLAAVVEEGGALQFPLIRTGNTSTALVVTVTVSETGDVVAAAHEGVQTVTFAPGDTTDGAHRSHG